MNFFTLSSLLIFITNFSIALFLFMKGTNRREIIDYASMCFFVSIWGLGSFLGSTAESREMVVFYYQIANSGAIFIPVAFYDFVMSHVNRKERIIRILIWIFAILFLASNILFKETFIYDVKLINNEFYYPDWHKLGFGYLLLYIFFYWILLTYSFFFLVQKLIKSTGPERNKIKYIIFGTGLGWLGGHNDFVSGLFQNIYPAFNILIAIYPLIIGYAIIKHNLMDINIVIKRSIVYSTLITILSILFLIIVIISERLSQNLLNYSSPLVSILAAIVFAMIFMPLRNKIQNIVDKYFFKGTTVQLAEQNEMLLKEVSEKERFKKVATLASGMAHEIKNPLTAIKTFTEYLEKHKNDPDFYTKFSRIVGKEVDRIDDLVHQLLEFSKPFPIELKESDAVKLVDDTLTFLDSQFLKSKITVHKIYDTSSSILVLMDPVQIRQVIVNIFINAAEAMKDGGQLTVTITRIKNQVVISTRDTGSGIAPEDLKHIFEPFFTKKDNGTGLGLSISYGIIAKHKGKIEVKSAVGVGTEFKIKLPVEKK